MISNFWLCYQNAFNKFWGLFKYAKVTILVVITLLNILYFCIHWIFDKASKFSTVVFFHHRSHAWSVPIDEYMFNNLQVANQYVFARIWSDLNIWALKTTWPLHYKKVRLFSQKQVHISLLFFSWICIEAFDFFVSRYDWFHSLQGNTYT